jgi:hypothetical protein
MEEANNNIKEANNIKDKRKTHRGNKVKEERNRKSKQLYYFRYRRSGNIEKYRDS